MSPPAEKARSPAAVITTRVTAGSFAQASSCSARARTIAWVTALSACGRFNVTRPADDEAHDLVGTFENLMHPHITQDPFDRMVVQIAIAAVELQTAVDDGKS